MRSPRWPALPLRVSEGRCDGCDEDIKAAGEVPVLITDAEDMADDVFILFSCKGPGTTGSCPLPQKKGLPFQSAGGWGGGPSAAIRPRSHTARPRMAPTVLSWS